MVFLFENGLEMVRVFLVASPFQIRGKVVLGIFASIRYISNVREMKPETKNKRKTEMFALLLTIALAGNADSSKVSDRAEEVQLPKIEFVKPSMKRVSNIKAPNEGIELALRDLQYAPRTELKEIPWETTINLCF
jgi:hypothetical protein